MQISDAIQAAIRRVNKDAPLYFRTTLEDRLGADLAPRRMQTSLITGFAVIALLMAAIGLYGVIHDSVAARTQEIGIRIAVGASAGEIFRMVLREGLQLTMSGLILGLLGALWVGRAGASLLFGVRNNDPETLVTVSVLFTAIALVACFPARRALKVDPIDALRHV